MNPEDGRGIGLSKSRTNCCVPQCTSYHAKNRSLSFPRQKDLKKQWMHVLKLGKQPGIAARVCSRHFESSDIRNTGGRNWIREGVVPSKNLPNSTFVQSRSKEQKILGELRKARALIRDSSKTVEREGKTGDVESAAPSSSTSRQQPSTPMARHKDSPSWCGAINCSNSKLLNPELSFHRVPRDLNRSKRWIQCSRREDLLDKSAEFLHTNIKFCSLHFETSQYYRNSKRLRQDALPTLFDVPNAPRRATSKRPLHERVEPNIKNPGPESNSGNPRELRSDLDVKVKIEPDDELAESSTDATCTPLDQKDVPPGDDHVYCRLPLDKSEDGDGGESRRPLRASAPASEEAALGNGPVIPRARKRLADGSPSPAGPPASAPPPLLTFGHGALTQHLVAMQKKQQVLHKLNDSYSSLVRKAEFRSRHPNWTEGDPPPNLSEPLLTLRSGRVDRFPALAPVDPLSGDVVLPQSPSGTWRTVATLRQQVLDLQLKVMHTRIMVVAGEIRMQEMAALHKRFKMNVQKELQRKVRAHVNSVRTHMKSAWMKKYRCQDFLNRPSKRTRQMEKLVERMEGIFTPMQLRVIRTGRKPKWTQEDIRRAIDLRLQLSQKDYDIVRKRLRIPLPSPKIMRQAVQRFTSLQPLFDGMVGDDKASDCEAKEDASTPPRRNGKPTKPPKKTSSESFSAEPYVVGRDKASRKLALRRCWSSPSHSPKQSPLARTPRPSQQPGDTSEGATASPPAHKRARVVLVVSKGATPVAGRCTPGNSARAISEGRSPAIVTVTKDSPQPSSGQPSRPSILRKRLIEGKTLGEAAARPPGSR